MSYWDTLVAAGEQLNARNFAEAESLFMNALDQRQHSPGRVFITEKVSDGLKRVWGGLSGRTSEADVAGRWPAAIATFRQQYRSMGEEGVRDAIRLSEFLPEDGATANQAVLLAALYLMTRSGLYPEELAPAIPVMKAAFRTALRSRQPFDLALIRPDLPFTEEDRLWLARKGDNLLETLFADDNSETATVQRKEWARVLIQLLQPLYFGSASRLEETRHWYEVLLTDRHIGEPDKALALYRSFISRYPEAATRVAMARVRLLEILGNIGGQYFAVPRYREVVAEINSGPPPVEVEAARRYAAAERVIGWRRPATEPNLAWASVSAATEGQLVYVFWWGKEPRDVAFWRPGEERGPLQDFLAPCAGRLVWAEVYLGIAMSDNDGDFPAGWPVKPFVEVFLEAQLPAEGLTAEVAERLAMSQAAAWRACWDWRRGHPLLFPPRQAASGRAPAAGAVKTAVSTGLLWLAVLERLRRADPCLQYGIREMAQRGELAANFLNEFLDLGSTTPELGSWRAWQVPPLTTRPDPLTSVPGSTAMHGMEPGPRPDLTGNDVAIVTTGNPGAVLSTWGAEASRWRVVLDHLNHFGVMAAAARSAGGLITLLPGEGGGHSFAAAVDLLESLLGREPGSIGDEETLLPLLHWTRLVETHNGDLLDFQNLRPHTKGAIPLFDIYAELVAGLPREHPVAEPSDQQSQGESWANQYRERALRSRLVAGLAKRLLVQPDQLDALWGVRRGGDAAWIFLDSPSVHWQLWQTEGQSLNELHQFLASRGQRHLSLVLAGQFLREDLEEMLGTWVAPYGNPYFLTLTDTRPAILNLAVGGIAPDARVLVLPGLLSQMNHLQDLFELGEDITIMLPTEQGAAPFWRDLAGGQLSSVLAQAGDWVTSAVFWEAESRYDKRGSRRLVVPMLASLNQDRIQLPGEDSPEAWAHADHIRRDTLLFERKLCALEVNALLASGVAKVDIADPRWWRRFPIPKSSEMSLLATRNEQAHRWAAEIPAVAYDLPEPLLPTDTKSRERKQRYSDPAPEHRLRHWLQEHGWIGPDGYGDPIGCERPSGAAIDHNDSPGIRLHLGSGELPWFTSAREIAARRERGDLSAWILVVGDHVPGGAADLVAAYPALGESIWLRDESESGAGAGEFRWGRYPDGPLEGDVGISPLLWMSPEVLQLAETQTLLESEKPKTILAGDLRHWLPQAGNPSLSAAATLRWLAHSSVPQVDLFATSLPVAWEGFLHRYWAEEVAERGTVIRHSPTSRLEPLATASDLPVAMGRLPALTHRCLDCQAKFTIKAEAIACPNCGLDSKLWLGEVGRDELAHDLLQGKLSALRDRTDLGHGDGLQVWLRREDSERITTVLREMGIAADKQGTLFVAAPSAENTWILTCAEPAILEPLGTRHAILYPPAEDLNDVAPLLTETESLSLWFHPMELLRTDDLSPRQMAYRCRRLLMHLAAEGWMDVLWQAEREPAVASATLSLPGRVLQTLCGMPVTLLLQSLNGLRWAAVLAGELSAQGFNTAVPAGESTNTLLARWTFAEVEYRALKMLDSLNILVPLWLASTRPGVPTYCDLAALPARIAADDLRWLDRFLIASSLRLTYHGVSREDQDTSSATDTVVEELLYQPVVGSLLSNRRRVGYLGSVQGVTARLRHHLELFLASVKMLMAHAVSCEDGIHIDLSHGHMGLMDMDTIELGCSLGLWRWWSRSRNDAVTLAELQALGNTAMVREGSGMDLLTDLAVSKLRWEDKLRRSLPLGLLDAGLLPKEENQTFSPVSKLSRSDAGTRDRIADLVLDGSRSTLVLRGWVGTGRLEQLVAGLGRAIERGQSHHALTIVCPDNATAVRFHAAWRREVGVWQPPLFLVSDMGSTGGGTEGISEATGTTTVLIEAHRIPPELRYQLCQQARHGPLLASVEVGEMDEPWDHLFLTTPAAEDILEFTVQRRQAKKIWREVRQLGPQGGKLGKTERREKGECQSRWAANLDECLACLVKEDEQGHLGERISVVAPLLDDLTYLGRRLAARGWLPVFRQELEYLQLPGPHEFLAAVSDVANQKGENESGDIPRVFESLLLPLLPASVRDEYQDWCRHYALEIESTTLREIYENICRTPWAATFLTHAQARARVEKLVRDVGDETPGQFFARPLWVAWRREASHLSAISMPPLRSRVVDLATADTPSGRLTKSLFYLCLGSEPATRHYKVLTRVTDRLLVLYQECSPLPSDADTQKS